MCDVRCVNCVGYKCENTVCCLSFKISKMNLGCTSVSRRSMNVTYKGNTCIKANLLEYVQFNRLTEKGYEIVNKDGQKLPNLTSCRQVEWPPVADIKTEEEFHVRVKSQGVFAINADKTGKEEIIFDKPLLKHHSNTAVVTESEGPYLSLLLQVEKRNGF